MKIENVKIINHNYTIENADVIIENKHIKEIIKKEGVASHTMIPGFIELHIHGFGGKDAMDSKEAVEYMSKELAKVGVTTFVPTLMTSSWTNILKSLRNASEAKSINSKIAGIHLEGPFISFDKKGAHNPEFIIEATKEKLDELYKFSNKKLIRLVMAPEVNSKEIMQYAIDLGFVVSIGHSNGKAQDVYDSIKLGATATTHLWNGMSGVANRDQGIVAGVLNNPKIYAELICDLVHVDSETIKLSIKSKGPEKIIVVSDSIRPAGLKDGEYKSGGIPVIKTGNKIQLKVGGSIAGGAGSVDIGYKTLLELGYSMEDIVKMTSYNASIHHNFDKIGEIKEGYFADFILLNEKKEVKKTYVNGVLINLN